MRNENL